MKHEYYLNIWDGIDIFPAVLVVEGENKYHLYFKPDTTYEEDESFIVDGWNVEYYEQTVSLLKDITVEPDYWAMESFIGQYADMTSNDIHALVKEILFDMVD